MMTSRSGSMLGIIMLVLIAGTITIFSAGCGDDDPASPAVFAGLAGGDSVTVELFINTIVRTYDDTLYLQWMELDAGLSGASFDPDTYVFAGSHVDTPSVYYRAWDDVRLVLDPATGDIDSLFCGSGYSSRGGGAGGSITALDVPLTSLTRGEGSLEAVWRLEGLMTCTVIDTLSRSWGPRGGRVESWTCAGDSIPFLEVRVTN